MGSWDWGLRTSWKVAWDKGWMSPLGGLTRNLSGDEVWTLKATGAVAMSDLRRTFALHLVPNTKSILTSCSDASTSLSIDERERERGVEDEILLSGGEGPCGEHVILGAYKSILGQIWMIESSGFVLFLLV